MAELLTDDLGRPTPQYLNDAGTAFESLKGASGALKDMSADGAHVTIGATTDALVAAGATGSVSAKLRRLTTDLDALNTLIGAVDAAAVADPAVSGALNALIKGILTDLGQTADVVVAAGAAGSISAKLRRLTTDLDTINTKVATLATEAKQDTLIAKDFATQTTLAAVLAKIIAAPATEAKQDTLIAKDFATQTTLAAILAKIIAAPATEAKQDTLIAKDFATQTTLATLLADATFTGRIGEVQASPTANTVLDRLKTLYTTLTDGNQKTQLTGSYPSEATPWTVTADSAAAGAVTATKAAVVDQSHYVTAIEAVISAAAAGNDITVILTEDAASAATAKWKEVIGNASPRGTRVGIAFPMPIKFTANKTADLVCIAGGASVVITANITGYTL